VGAFATWVRTKPGAVARWAGGYLACLQALLLLSTPFTQSPGEPTRWGILAVHAAVGLVAVALVFGSRIAKVVLVLSLICLWVSVFAQDDSVSPMDWFSAALVALWAGVPLALLALDAVCGRQADTQNDSATSVRTP